MKLTGHRTESVYRRYAIVSEADLSTTVVKLAALHESEAAAARTVVRFAERTGKAGVSAGPGVLTARSITTRMSGGGRGIRTPKGLAARWISRRLGRDPQLSVISVFTPN
jgi:hypothetical protein